MSEIIDEEKLRNTRAWACARPDMSGSAVIVSAIDELLDRRAAKMETCQWSPLTNKRWPDYAAISITTGCGVFIGTADQHAFANRLRNGNTVYCIGCGKPIEVNTP